jgi:hypothetical protein
LQPHNSVSTENQQIEMKTADWESVPFPEAGTEKNLSFRVKLIFTRNPLRPQNPLEPARYVPKPEFGNNLLTIDFRS